MLLPSRTEGAVPVSHSRHEMTPNGAKIHNSERERGNCPEFIKRLTLRAKTVLPVMIFIKPD